jgi:glutamate-ammonia-ligase adenylyltransferase
VAAADVDLAVERSADPAGVRVLLDHLTTKRPELGPRLHDDESLRAAIIAVGAASRWLGRLCLADAGAVDVLAALDRRPELDPSSPEQLAVWRRHEHLRIAARDLLGLDDLETVGARLSDLAAEVLTGAWRLAGPAAAGLAIIGMGKFGAGELNYASDVDVIFVGDGDPRRILDVARLCFRVDTDLRPEGRDGPLTRSLASYQAYWDRWAQPWEFQALLKARSVAGDAGLGHAFAAAAAKRVWSRPLGADELRSLRAMKARAENEIARKGLADREVKRGRGGIRDVEFAVQLLQLVHGRADPALRSPATLAVLSELGAAGYVDGEDAQALADAYRLLRTVEHRLQLVEDRQVHAVPESGPALDHLARVLGYRDRAEQSAADQFSAELRRHQATVRSIHERLFFRPLLEAFTSATAPLTPEAAADRLAAFGFSDAERTRLAVRELTRGFSRGSRLMAQLLPLLLEWLSQSPDPDLGLLGLRTLASGQFRNAQLMAVFRESTEAARQLCALLGTGRPFITLLERSPELLGELGGTESLTARPAAQLLTGARAALDWREELAQRQAGLGRFKAGELWRIAAADVLGMEELQVTARRLADLAEVVLHAALETVAPPLPLAVIAVGRLGGAELAYASDLDLLVVYDGSTAADQEAAEEATQELFRFIQGDTPAMRIYPLDAGLRPEGKQGLLARSIEGYRLYLERYARTWERQALIRARPVAGDADLAARFQATVDPFVWEAPVTQETVREIRRMKARIERERIPAGDDPQFHLKLGRGSLSDVEWTAQLLQLQHGVRSQGTLVALDVLEAAGILDPADRAILADAYEVCERFRNRAYLVRGAPTNSLPAAGPQLTRLARSFNLTSGELRDEYRRVTRRAREVMERLFYGAADRLHTGGR